jgi:chromosome segregation ATPase
MGSCISSKTTRKYQVAHSSQKIKNLKMDIEKAEKELGEAQNKLNNSQDKLKFIKAENQDLRYFLASMRSDYSTKTINFKQRLDRQREESEYYRVQFHTLQNKLSEKTRINLILVDRYNALGTKCQRKPVNSCDEQSYGTSVSSKSFI